MIHVDDRVLRKMRTGVLKTQWMPFWLAAAQAAHDLGFHYLTWVYLLENEQHG